MTDLRERAMGLGAWLAIAGSPLVAWWLADVAVGEYRALDTWWTPADALVPLVAAGGAVVAGYLAATGVFALVSGVVSHGRVPRWTSTAMPRAWRSVVAAAVAVTVVAGGGGAAAATDSGDATGAAPDPTAASSRAPEEGGPASLVSHVGWIEQEVPASQVEGPGASPTPSSAAVTPPADASAPNVGPRSSPAVEPAPDAVPGAAGASSAPSARDDRAEASTYEVRRGDSLWAIAARELGGSASDADITAAWQQIYRANRALIGADPGLIYPGQLLTIPVAVAA